jgi:molybdopterin synthase catalytic subunit
MRRRAVHVLVPCILGGHAAECTDAIGVRDRGRALAMTPPQGSGASPRVAARSAPGIRPYNVVVASPPTGADWIELSATPLPTDRAVSWATTPASGAVVSFLGVVRDHAEGRTGVVGLDYEAYEEEAVRVLGEIAAEARRRWPEVERLALLHRTGRLELSEPSVAVVVSSPHRADAFEAARWCIDTLKESAPIWKREHWSDGSDWSPAEQPIRPVVEPTRSRA